MLINMNCLINSAKIKKGSHREPFFIEYYRITLYVHFRLKYRY